MHTYPALLLAAIPVLFAKMYKGGELRGWKLNLGRRDPRPFGQESAGRVYAAFGQSNRARQYRKEEAPCNC